MVGAGSERSERTMTELDGSGFADFDRLLAIVRRTREVLDRVAGDGALPPGGADYLAEEALPHLDGIQAGFVGWLRSDAAGAAELRHLLRLTAAIRVEAAVDDAERRAELAEAEAERSRAARPRPIHRARAWDLASLAHARVVLAFVPRLPEAEVRYPAGRRSYADIPAPRGPAELAERIDELERQLWRAATGRLPAASDPAFRRTYGFFDTADRLGWAAFRQVA
jgi:hypothetical protein